jgi:hypothetical protein
LEALLGENIGPRPSSQQEVEELAKDGESRYEQRVFPGFMDTTKEKPGKPELSTYRHNGLLYQAKYGDLMIWRQIINHAKATDIKRIILITGSGRMIGGENRLDIH